jgi:hypothetical protein
MDATSYTTETSTVEKELQTAIDALTTLARAERMSASGLPVRYDFAEIVSRSLAIVAANVGSLDAMLGGGPDSWQAHYIRQLVAGTVPEDELLTQRTAPVQLHLDVAGAFFESGQAWQFDQEWSVAQLAVRDAATPEEAAEARDLAAAMNDLYEQDKAAYLAAYTAVVRDELTKRGLPAETPVEVVDAGAGVDGPDRWWDLLAEALHTRAAGPTPLPNVLADPEALGYTQRAARLLAARSVVGLEA